MAKITIIKSMVPNQSTSTDSPKYTLTLEALGTRGEIEWIYKALLQLKEP